MPTESAVAADPNPPGPSYSPPPMPIKCMVCGSGATPAGAGHQDGVIVFSEPLERICGSCVRSQDGRRVRVPDVMGLGIVGADHALRSEVRGVLNPSDTREVPRVHTEEDLGDEEASVPTEPLPIPRLLAEPLGSNLHTHAQSLPSQPARPWSTTTSLPHTISEIASAPASPKREKTEDVYPDTAPNPLLDVTRSRIPSIGRGALSPAVFSKEPKRAGEAPTMLKSGSW
jgi:hypothetical protein